MRVRHPPGRAGRPWLARRLAVARRGAELLDEKHRALTRERLRLEPLVREARLEWERRAREAELWMTRAAVLGSRRQLTTAAAAPEPATLTVRRRSVLGVACPVGAELAAGGGADPAALGAGAALLCAAAAHRRAVAAALDVAVLDGALRRVHDELRRTALRRNAIEQRWIPAHEAALAELEIALEELEREDGARVRWVTGGSVLS
jgi:V/A-type H+-transporting ATPase subunit D